MEYLVLGDDIKEINPLSSPGRPGENDGGGGGKGDCPYDPDKMCPCHSIFRF